MVSCPESAFEEGKDFRLDGSIVSVKCDFPCKIGYYSEGKYVSCQLVYTSDDRHMFEVPSGIGEVILVVKGDASMDGVVNLGDATRIIAYYKHKLELDPGALFAADVDDDSIVSLGDATRITASFRKKYTIQW